MGVGRDGGRVGKGREVDKRMQGKGGEWKGE